MRYFAAGLLLMALLSMDGHAKSKPPKPPSAIDSWIEQATSNDLSRAMPRSAGSLYTDRGPFADPSRDPRASQVGDLVTIVVSDRASAVTKGTAKTARKSSTTASINGALGPLKSAGTTAPLLSTTGDTQLDASGQTTRENTLTTTLSAQVTHVLPNGYLVVEGSKHIGVNSEQQTVSVRGVLRPADLDAGNNIASNRLAALEIQVNGKGVIGDAVRRPFILYRLLLGLLPF